MTAPAPHTPDPLMVIRRRRDELRHVEDKRARGQAGYADVATARYRVELAILAAIDAGAMPYRHSVDTAALLHVSDTGDGTYGVAV